jgi:class 3 adenylate cyclase/predicted ATPase
MQQIADWLETLGMSEYAKVFGENRIDFSVLPDLTDHDLEKMGVILGDRRKMLRAIAALNGAPPAATSAASTAVPALATPTVSISAAAPPTNVRYGAEAAGERRHITVMFCDLVDSTGIVAKLDAEEWRDLVGDYLQTASVAVTEIGGHVAKKLGDGLMAVFGYPIAQENDAERATRAALSIQRALSELNRKNEATSKPALAARIAIDTGEVVIDTAGEIFGDVPNIAARAQSLAEPGAVVVTARVQRQVAGMFFAEERGSHQLKGVPEPVTLFRIVRVSGGVRRLGQRNLTPLVGRDEEIAMLMRRWERARQGDGQLVLISGEPGLGKSRLIEEFHNRLGETPHTWAEWFCSQLLQNTPLHPFAEWGRQRFGGAEVLPERRLEDLENTLATVKLDAAEHAALLGPLMDIPIPSNRALTLAPEEARRRQLGALTNWIMFGARTMPLVLVLEDLHWADPTTLELMRGIAERGALAPLLVLATTRPEFRPSWNMRSHHSTISLAPLDRQQVRHMVGELSARHALPQELIDGVTERTGGVPLFIEEVTRYLLERGEHGSGVQAIPPTLQQSLTARLDRLGAAREVAQICAVIGRGFSYTLLRAVAGLDDATLQGALDRLADADILLVQGLPPDSDYRFKHALIQDAAYENLLKSRRQTLHRHVAEALRDNVAGAEPELLAHHFTQAGLTEAAREWWGKAGQRSLERSALIEAAAQFTRALDQIANLPASTALRRDQIKLQVGLASALMPTKGHAASETKAAFERALVLIQQAETLGDPPEDPLLLFSVLYGLWAGRYAAFNGDAVRELATQFLALAEKENETVPLMVGHRIMGISLAFTGDLQRARTHLDCAMRLYDPAKHRALATRFGQDIGAAILFQRCLPLWMLGYPEAALADCNQVIRAAREIDHAATSAYALHFTTFVHIFCGNHSDAAAQSNELVALAHEKGSAIWEGLGVSLQGWISSLTDQTSDATQIISSGIETLVSTGLTLWKPFWLSSLARAYADRSQFDDAQRSVNEAMTVIEATRENWCEPEVNRIAGEIALKLPQPNARKAQAHFERAITVARAQQARSWELRAATSMARLWRHQGKSQQARELLAPVYGWFTEGFDTRDLKEAKALLAELA